MKEEWKEWFISKINEEVEEYDLDDRRYSYLNLFYTEVPFHEELKKYIFSLNPLNEETDYEVYHIHIWKEGDFFEEHIDNNFNRRWSFVSELQSSECGTTLLVEGNPLKEGLFDFKTKHEVPKIQNGTRISLTVFGNLPNSLI